MNGFRSRLWNIPDEKALFEFFEKNARYAEGGIYYCAGVYSNDTKELFSRLKEEWRVDRKDRAKEALLENQGSEDC